MGVLTITHSAAEGTLLEGTSRGDGSGEVVKRLGWRWGRSIGLWFVPRSRDQAPKRALIASTVAALRAAGFEVAEPEIDAQARSAAVVEADRVARQAERVEALNTKAGARDAVAAVLEARADAAVAALPPGGEPIKVGWRRLRPRRRPSAR